MTLPVTQDTLIVALVAIVLAGIAGRSRLTFSDRWNNSSPEIFDVATRGQEGTR